MKYDRLKFDRPQKERERLLVPWTLLGDERAWGLAGADIEVGCLRNE